MSDVMIEAKELTKRYGEFTALDKASFEVRKGEVLGFLGPNGAGKTTTMKILTCFIAPTEGTAKVNGCDVFDDPNGVRQALGYLPEANPLYKEMLVVEYLRWVGEMRGLSGDKLQKRLKTVVEQTSLGDVFAKEIRALSKGYRQRVGLAQALLHEPPVLILDEPMSGLDPNQTIEIRELIKEIGRERTVIFSSHNLAEVSVTCDRVLIVSQGKIVADANPNDLRARAGKPTFIVALRESQNGQTYRDASLKASEVLRAIKGVHDVKEVPGAPSGEMHFEVIANGSTDLRPAIFQGLAEAQLTLVELFRKRIDLEAVFRDLTTSDDAPKKKRAKSIKERAKERAEAREAREDEEDEAAEDEEAALDEEEERASEEDAAPSDEGSSNSSEEAEEADDEDDDSSDDDEKEKA